jgi:hypothetical protein
MNLNTGFIDASMVYGSTKETLKEVRAFGQKGAMASTKLSDGRKMLPISNAEGCSTDTIPSEVPRCHFGAGMRIVSSANIIFLLTVLVLT